MVIKNSKNKFSLAEKISMPNQLNKLTLEIKDIILINVLDNPFKYIISIYLRGLYKDTITLSYINNFLIMDFTFKDSNYSSLKYKRTFYLKNIDITKFQNVCSSNLIYITLPKKFK